MAKVPLPMRSLLLVIVLCYGLPVRSEAGKAETTAGPGADSNGTSVSLWEQGSPAAIDPQFILTNATTEKVLQRVASANREIIFTTIRLPRGAIGEEVSMLANFCYYLSEQGALQHTMVLTTDNRTFTLLHDRGFPVYLDRAFPERSEYTYGGGAVSDSPNRVFDVQKHWWGWNIINRDFRAVYMDADAVPLRDVFKAFEAPYEVQGLSDWNLASVPPPDRQLEEGCGLYYWIHDPATATSTILREWWRFPGNPTKLFAMTPCQSTGVWYLQPTRTAQAFMLAMVHRLTAPRTLHEWDQTAWNEVILPFLFGTGEGLDQLRYRLLPHAGYANVGVVNMRKEAGLPVDLLVLHSGYLHGAEKSAAYEAMGYWKPELFSPAPAGAEAPGATASGPTLPLADGAAAGTSSPESPDKVSVLHQGDVSKWMASRSAAGGGGAVVPWGARSTALGFGALAVMGLALVLLLRRDSPGRALLMAVRRTPRTARLLSTPEEKRTPSSPKTLPHASV